MAGVFQNIKNIDPPPTHRPESVYPPPLMRGEDTLAGGGGGGVNILEDAKHCSVLYIRKYFVVYPVLMVSLSLSLSIPLYYYISPPSLRATY
jgi:hypothetical protein